MFFGRRELLRRLTQTAGNHVLVGRRQVGKSSLLRAVQREIARTSNIDCYYIPLSGPTLDHAVARAVGRDISFQEVLDDLAQNRKSVFLIDEADTFVLQDREDGYPRLRLMQHFNDGGYGSFVLAGFWPLYEAAELEESPLRSFEPIHLGPLDPDACSKLAEDPMDWLNIRYQSNALVRRIIDETGRQPALISIVCNELLSILKPSSHTIVAADLDTALSSSPVSQTIRLHYEDVESMLILSMLEENSFTRSDVEKRSLDLGLDLSAQEIDRALAKLEFAGVFQKGEHGYAFGIPLERRLLLESHPEDRLQRLLATSRRATNRRSA